MTRQVFGPASEKQRMVLQDNTTDVILVGGGAGGGKALRHGEKVLTPSGFVPIESLSVGDKVISPDNTIENVLNVWPQGVVDIYRVTFQDGRTIDCCENHLWNFHIAGKGNKSTRTGNTKLLKEIVNKELSKAAGERKRLPIIPLVSPIDFANNELLIKPYTLGAMLGDGCTSSGNNRMTGVDDFIFDRIESEGYSFGKIAYKKLGSNTTNIRTQTILNLSDKLKQLNLDGKVSHTKFIPEVYKKSTTEDRFSIVQGLMDTDGYVSKDGKTYFDTTSEQLAKDLIEILYSLGFSCTLTTSKGSYKKDGVVVECKDVYSVYIRGEHQQKLFSLPRKAERTKLKNVGLRIESVEYVGKDFATCIAISGESKLFVTTNYIVTHNSAICLMKQLDAIHDPLFRCTIFRRTAPELKRQGGLVDESKKVYKHFDAIYKTQAQEWCFPSGAKVSFSAIATDDDLGGWQGSQLTRVDCPYVE